MQTRDAPRLVRVRRLDSIRLDAADRTYFTEEGYLVDHPILTSCGIFEYTKPDGGIRRELRLPEHVFSEKSLKSYRGKPIIITHEAGAINKDNVDREQIGTILTDGYQDGEDVRAEIIIHDTDAMKASGLKELSLGYSLDLIEKPGKWHGEPYDAIQTNIVINHLALVASARAGGQARLNIDGSDGPELKGGKCKMNNDSIELTPEELLEAIKCYKASKAGSPDGGGTEPQPKAADGEVEPTAPVPQKETEGPETTPPAPKEENKDDKVSELITTVEALLAEIKGAGAQEPPAGAMDGEGEPEGMPEEPENNDCSDDQSQSMNNDSADVFAQKLAVCRIGDKLHMDGLEKKSILDAKKAIVAKVLPTMRLDGKNEAYIQAAYDIAVGQINSTAVRKGTAYQRKQMVSANVTRADGGNKPMAASARERMIEREGGKQ